MPFVDNPPTFNHENTEIETYVKSIIGENFNLPNQAQYIIMAGISLGDLKLIEYSCKIDPDAATTPIPEHIVNVTNIIFKQDTESSIYEGNIVGKIETGPN